MRIAIVDDDREFAKKIKLVIEAFCREAVEEVAVRHFPDGESLLEELRQEELRQEEPVQERSSQKGLSRERPGQERGWDACLLDVEMPGLDGLELARRILEREEDTNIVFLSDFEKYALPAHKVRTCDYILKEKYEAELPAVLNQILTGLRRRNQEDYYLIQNADMMERLHLEEIRYLTKEKKYVVFYGREGQLGRERTTLEKVYERLPHERFLYVNKGCIINMKHIVSLRKEIVALDNRVEHVISRIMAPEVRKKVAGYWGRMKW